MRTQVTSMVGRPSVAAQASTSQSYWGGAHRQPKPVQLVGCGAVGLPTLLRRGGKMIGHCLPGSSRPNQLPMALKNISATEFEGG